MSEHYLEQRVLKRVDQETIGLYRCLFRLETKQYGVQSLDFFSLPISSKRFSESEIQFFELFCETSPVERCKWYESLSEAIRAHDHDFSE